MLNHGKIETLGDFFKGLGERKAKGVYFYRINGYNGDIDKFIKDYYEAARKMGVVIEGRIPNPDDKNLAYYNEIMGMSFEMSLGFITSSLRRWLPRMNDGQRDAVAVSIYDCLDLLRKSGKNENMLKNTYIKFMCWLYFKFERIVGQLGQNALPKILYEADVSHYELMLLSILSNAGCDIVLLQYKGDENYLKLDPQSLLSDEFKMQGMGAFPENYNLKAVQRGLQEAFQNKRLYGALPELRNCTNAWITGKNVFDDARTPPAVRGSDRKFFYNCFCRVSGVEDKLTYLNDLHRLAAELKNGGRKVVIADGQIAVPSMEEIGQVKRQNAYQKQDQMLLDLSGQLVCSAGADLQALVRKAFLDEMLAEGKDPDMNVNRLTNKAVYMVCWLKRYIPQLFGAWRWPDVGCFIRFGACKNENEAMFLRMLARLPVDVLVLVPNLNETCVLDDPMLFEHHFSESLNVSKYPREAADLQVGTSAYHAERELDAILYQDSGLYRNKQYAKANAVTLKTMYEEIRILWKEEVKYRPNFETVDGVANIPVIFSKISGVKDGDVVQYWNSVRELTQEESLLITDVPYIEPTAPNPMKAFAVEFFKNRKLLRDKIKNHKSYPYGFLREDMQEHMLDKLQLLIDQRVIKGTFENGTEYTIVATVLGLDKELLRMLQKFDFTKKNPKMVYVNAGEKMLSLEDSIVAAFLNMAGFDVIFFVPTGYQNIEKHFQKKLFEEHQIGEYVYDLQIPNLRLPPAKQSGWRNIFKRG